MTAGWERRPIGSFILDIKDGGTPARSNLSYFGADIPWCVVKDIRPEIHETREMLSHLGLANCSAKVWPAGSVIISLGATIGEIGIARIPVATKQGLAGIIPDPGQITSEFLAYALKERVEEIKSMARGTTIKEVRPRRLAEELQINVPQLGEQRRIVAVLDEAFAAIATATANAEKNLANARELFESYGEALFSDLLNAGIDYRALGDLTAPGAGITYGVVKPGGEGAVAFVRGGDLVDGVVRMDRLRTISEEFSRRYRRTLLRGGELLICLVGTPGQCAIAPKELAGANIARQVGMIRLHEGENAEYIRDYLLSCVGQKALGLKTGGSVQQVINLGDLKSIEIPLPAASLQSEIVGRLRLMKESALLFEQHYRDKLVRLIAFKQSLLQCALSGELAPTENEYLAA